MKSLLKNKITMFFTKDNVEAVVLNYDFENNCLITKIGNKRALLRPEDMSIYQSKKISTNEQLHNLLGCTIHADIIGKNSNNDILLSRALVMKRNLNKFHKGDVVEAKIVSLSDNALYFEFDEGLIGKMYINQLTSAKLDKPVDLYRVGEKMKCEILKKQEDGRFLLSRISLYRNPLELLIGSIVECRITKKLNENDGYFVEVVNNPNISGIFDINKHNNKKNYRIGEFIKLRVAEKKADKKFKFQTYLVGGK